MHLNISGGFLGLRGGNGNLNMACVGTESKADIRRWDNNGARSTERYEDIVREERVW
jgi:hypothetical protein